MANDLGTQSRHSAARKSVAFTDEKIVVSADGSVTMVASPSDEAVKETAQSHASRTPPLSAALEAFTDAPKIPRPSIATLSTSRS